MSDFTPLRGLTAAGGLLEHDQARRLAAHGAEVHAAADVFVRRERRAFADWLAGRARLAGDDFTFPVRTAFFLAVLPLCCCTPASSPSPRAASEK